MVNIGTLKTPMEVSTAINCVVAPERLAELADSGLAPHYIVDGNVYFGMSEIKEWLNHNWLLRRPGQHIGENFATIVNVVAPTQSKCVLPVALRFMEHLLVPMSLESVENAPICGVYFLCSNDELVYIGQGGNVFNRIGAHFGNKTFDFSWLMRVPKSDLNFIEHHLIEKFAPKYNYGKNGKLILPGLGYGYEPTEANLGFVAMLSNDAECTV